MKNIILYLYFAFLLILSSGCKQTAPSPATSLRASMLAAAWKITKVTDMEQNSVIYQNPLNQGQSITEDYSRYRLNFTTTAYTLTDKEGITDTGVWELASNDTKLILDKGLQGKETIMNIIELTSSSLKVIYTESSTKTGNRELHIDLIHQ